MSLTGSVMHIYPYPDVLTSVGVGVFFLLSCQFAYGHFISKKHHRLPPGPKSLPLLGSALELPAMFPEKGLFLWGKRFGSLVYARIFQTPTIVINSLHMAQEIMDKRSANYSGRPVFTLQTELLGWDGAITHMNYDARFKKHRKWIQDAMQPTDLIHYRVIQRRETYTLLSGLCDSPDDFMSHIRRYTASVIIDITYGHRVTSLHDRFVELAERAGTETILLGTAGSALVDFFPILKHYPTWLPFSGFRHKAREIKEHVRQMHDVPYDVVKEKMASGTAAPSFTSKLLEESFRIGRLTKADEEDIKGAAGVLYAAGSDTTVAVVSSFILMIVRHPEVFDKAREEIDRVIGTDRLPDHDDRESLPYLECVMKEVYRFQCAVPLGIPHSSMKDDEYQGYRIPGGSVVVGNIWGMTQDAEIYPKPELFSPERFEGLDKSRLDTIDPRKLIFGFGRRICPGRQLADASVFLIMATMIATLDISKPRDEFGNEYTPPADYVPGFVIHPKPFQCTIRPRSQKAVELIAQANVVS